MHTTPEISVALCTYKRPAMLADCLKHLVRQKTSHRFEIVVVDNDSEGSGKATVESMVQEAAGCGIGLSYHIEPMRSIAAARNLSVAKSKAELIAFIDDDEYPAEDWLEQLCQGLERTKADGLFGPVLPVFPDSFPAWQRPLFELDSKIDGKRVASGGSGNAIFKTKVLQMRTGPFDLSLGRTGGSDHELFHWLTKNGCMLCWCENAKAYEYQPEKRAKLGWHIKRGYRTGWTRAFRIHREKGGRKAFLKSLSHLFTMFSILRKSLVMSLTHPRASLYFFSRRTAKVIGGLGYWASFRVEDYQERSHEAK